MAPITSGIGKLRPRGRDTQWIRARLCRLRGAAKATGWLESDSPVQAPASPGVTDGAAFAGGASERKAEEGKTVAKLPPTQNTLAKD